VSSQPPREGAAGSGLVPAGASDPASATAVGEARARLRAAGAELRRRPAAEVLELLARVLERWRDPASQPRRALEAELPRATGFSPAMVREGVERGLAPWSGEALGALVERELGGLDALDALEGRARELVHGFELTAVVLAGAIPMPALLEILAPLVLRSPVLVKASAHDPVTPALVARSLVDADPELGRCVEVVRFPGDAPAFADCAEALCEADCVAATGSDAAVAALGARVRPPRRFVGHGHRLSVACVGPGALAGPAVSDLARRLALDTASWDQLGCLSPVAVWVVGRPVDALRLGETLAEALAAAESRWPRGRVPGEAAARAAEQRSLAQMREARVWTDGKARWTLVCEPDAVLRPAPLFRFLRIHPVADEDELLDALRPLAPHLACAAIEGFGPRAGGLATALGALGASRVCRPGEMQSPPLDWPRDGLGVLAPLARRTRLG